jgi:hypothetical protein
LKVELLLCRWIERSRADLELREVVGEKKRKEISLVLARKKKARQQKVRKGDDSEGFTSRERGLVNRRHQGQPSRAYLFVTCCSTVSLGTDVQS